MSGNETRYYCFNPTLSHKGQGLYDANLRFYNTLYARNITDLGDRVEFTPMVGLYSDFSGWKNVHNLNGNYMFCCSECCEEFLSNYVDLDSQEKIRK